MKPKMASHLVNVIRRIRTVYLGSHVETAQVGRGRIYGMHFSAHISISRHIVLEVT